ncbi:hypothetical protein ACWD5V_30895 [Streptomyces sp. NPDC002523]
MRRGLVHVLAWLLSTGAAVTLSWWGVHTVMTHTVYDPPRALPVAAQDTTPQGEKASAPPATRPSPPPSPKSPSATSPSSPAPSRTPSRPATGSPTASATASGRIKSYDTAGGRAVFDLGSADATLVSAAPGPGWSMQVWKTQTWIRIEFARDTDRVSVFCAWHDGPPHVEVNTY